MMSIRNRRLTRDAFWRSRITFNTAAGNSMHRHPNIAAPLRTALCTALCGTLWIGSALARESVPKPATRCGWFVNSTPGNAWLIDRDGEWTIGIQGGHQADGDWPEFRDAEWVVTNSGYHGYGCACLKLVADPHTQEVARIVSARTRPLQACRQDAALPKQP
jgi:hypothetical protein